MKPLRCNSLCVNYKGPSYIIDNTFEFAYKSFATLFALKWENDYFVENFKCILVPYKEYHPTQNDIIDRGHGAISNLSIVETLKVNIKIWRLRDMKIRFELKWEIKENRPEREGSKYNPGGKDCKLCSAEKYHILMEDDKRSLNVRSELLSKCRHRAKWKLDKLIL